MPVPRAAGGVVFCIPHTLFDHQAHQAAQAAASHAVQYADLFLVPWVILFSFYHLVSHLAVWPLAYTSTPPTPTAPHASA